MIKTHPEGHFSEHHMYMTKHLYLELTKGLKKERKDVKKETRETLRKEMRRRETQAEMRRRDTRMDNSLKREMFTGFFIVLVCYVASLLGCYKIITRGTSFSS